MGGCPLIGAGSVEVALLINVIRTVSVQDIIAVLQSFEHCHGARSCSSMLTHYERALQPGCVKIGVARARARSFPIGCRNLGTVCGLEELGTRHSKACGFRCQSIIVTEVDAVLMWPLR